MRVERSSGGAVLAILDGVPHLAMIATREGTRWGLPKGAAYQGESSEQAALREVREETGLEAEVVVPLETIEYFFRADGTLIRKFVDFFLMAHRGGRLAPQLSEVDDAAWVPLERAVEQSSFHSERAIIEKLVSLWNAMPPEQRSRFES